MDAVNNLDLFMVGAFAVAAAWDAARRYFQLEASKIADNTAMARLERKFYEHEAKTAQVIENIAKGVNDKFIAIDDRLGSADIVSVLNRKRGA